MCGKYKTIGNHAQAENLQRKICRMSHTTAGQWPAQQGQNVLPKKSLGITEKMQKCVAY